MKRPPLPLRWFVLTLLLCLAAASPAGPRIAPTLEEIEPVATGEPAPAFTVHREDGSPFHFRPGELERPVLLIFYRGSWCGACNQQLRELADFVPAIREAGADLLFVGGDRPDILYKGLKPETKAAIEGLDYTLLSDPDLDAAGAFGVAYVLAADVLARYRSREEWDLAESSMEKYDALPLPSIFIIGTDGRVAFDFYNLDPAVRMSSEEVLEAVRKVTNR